MNPIVRSKLRGRPIVAAALLSLVALASWPAHSQAAPPPAGQEIKSVSCPSSTMCMAVGKTSGNHSVIENWDGTAWSLVQSPDGEIKSVSCASTTACVAVGVAAEKAQSWMIFELGGGWLVAEVAPPMSLFGTEGALNGVYCGPSACTAVGYSKVLGNSYSPLIDRWNGSSWSQQTAASPLLTGGPNVLLSVSCGSESSCTAVGEAGGKPFAESWNGATWQSSLESILGGPQGKLASVSCPSAAFCVAVGNYSFENNGEEKPLAESWNGSAWSLLTTPSPSDAKGYVNLTGVSCLSSSSCSAVGYYASSLISGVPLETKTLAESWNGAGWTIKTTPNPAGKPYNALLGVSCSSASACTAVGGFTETLLGPSSPLAERWNGSAWSLQTVVPSIAAADSATLTEDASATAIDVLANDSEAIPGTKEIVSKTNGSHGTVAITGGGTGLTYTPAANYCGSDSFTYTLNGGSTGTVSVTVTCVDDPPVAVNDSATLAEDASATLIDALANDTDVDGGTKSIVGKTNGAHGAVAILGGGAALSYTPEANYCGSDSFTYTLNGGSTATVSVTVTCVDDPPVAVDDSATIAEDAGATAIPVLANDTDIDGGPKSIASKTNAVHGTAAITGGGTGLTYTPDPNYCGSDSLTYSLAPGGSSATISITVTCVDDPPVAVADSKTLVEDAGPTAIEVLANDTDIDGGPKSVASKTDGAHGTVAITGGGTGLTYTPAANYCGSDSFTYTLNGGSTATVSITVTCVDDPPVAVNDSATLVEDAAATAINVLANDTDVDAGPKEVASKTDGAHGTVAITGGGTGLTYTPAANYCGSDSFTYTLNGGSTGTVSVTITCVDDPPVAVNDSKTLVEDAGPTAIEVLANDTDVDGGPKQIVSKSEGSHGTVNVLAGGIGLTYAPAANYCGNDSFSYELNGGSTATVSITVTCVDDLPTAVNDSATLAEDAGATAVDVLANDTDVDGGPKEVVSKTNGSHGAVAITGGGAGLTYTPAANYCGPDSFTYTLNGGSTATVSVTVTCVDDPPVAVNDSATVAENAAAQAVDVLANDTDIDGGPKSVASKTNGAHGTVAIIGGGAALTYQPAAGYCGSDSFTYTLNGDSTATVSVTVTCVDEPPVAVDDSATLAEDASAQAIDVLANDTDADGGPKSIASKTNAAHGTVAITGGGSGLTYQPAANYCGSDSFTYTLNGGSTATVSVTVTCVDDPPVAVNDSATFAEDSGANAVDVLADDTDIDGGPKTVGAKTDGAHGTVAITGGGSGLTYQPAANYCGSDSFTYELNGGSTATVSVTVTCVDDPPTAVADSDTVLENSAAQAIDVLANDTDIDGGPISVTGKTNGAHGSVATIGGGAGLTYQPEANYCGPDSFTYTLNGGSTATVSISVTCVAPPEEKSNGGGGGGGGGTQTIIQNPPSTGPVINVTPGVGVVSGRRHPRIAVKNSYAFFTLTCGETEHDCSGTVTIWANLPSIALGPTMRKVVMVKGSFRIGSHRSVLVRAKLTKRGLKALESKRSLRGVSATMAIADSGNGEKGEIEVTLVRRPKASELGEK
jgi:hypothetical protein